MAQKIFMSILRSLMAIAIVALSTVFASCEESLLEKEVISTQEIEKKDSDPELTFDPVVDESTVDTADVTSKIFSNEVDYGIRADMVMAEYDYMIERKYKQLNHTYCNAGAHKNLVGLGSENVVSTFALEDGNVAMVYVYAPILGTYSGEQRPYWAVKDINITKIRNYKESGDSLWTEVTALVTFNSVGISPSKQAALTLKDSVIRVMVAEADVVVRHRYDRYREVVSDNVEQIQVVKTDIWKSGRETSHPAFVQLLPRTIGTINLGEQETMNFGSFTTYTPQLTKGTAVNASDVNLSVNFTALQKRTDVYRANVRNQSSNSFDTEYKLTHYGVTFNDGDTTIVFPLVDWTVSEVSNVLSATTGSIANAEYKTLTNNVRTMYLEYVQNASETGRLYKKGDEVTEGWDAEASWLRVNGNKVLVHGVWVRHHSIGGDETSAFDTTFVRRISANTWEIYTSSQNNTTGANAISKSNSAKSHGVWSWQAVTNTVTENVAFADGSRQNVFTGVEYADIALTYKGKKLAFRNYSYEYSEGSVNGPTANGTNGDYNVFKQNTTVNAIASGNQSISATANGTIYVKKEIIPPFFPAEYGKFEGAKFSATVNPYKENSWYFGCSMTFEKGTLALPIDQQGNPDWDHMTWWPGIKDAQLNGAFYVKRFNKWYPAIAIDGNNGMEWSLCSAQGSYGLYLLDLHGADTYGDWNCNDKNSRGQHTVLTNRFRVENDTTNGKLTLFFNGQNKGSWTYAK
jgi:hypothetical protein